MEESQPILQSTDKDVSSWLRLIRSDKVGPVTFWQLINRYGTAHNALKALGSLIQQSKQKFCLATEEACEKELKAHHSKGLTLLPAFEEAFPQRLKTLPDCPPVLSVFGQLEILNQPALGIVGARNASLNGRKFAENLARDLTEEGWKIVSGLAQGIDSFAHQGALNKGTIAVVAGGADVIYPRENAELYHSISRQGAVISEMPLSLFPDARHFPRRNRLISGLSQGVIIVEAALRSGSMITARTALDQGREVFAVPGSPLEPRCKGTNHLIREGAGLVESAADVLSYLKGPCGAASPLHKPIPAVDSPAPPLDWTNLEKDIFQDLSLTPLSMEDIIQQHKVPSQVILTLMLEWELEGRIQRHPGNRISLAS